ncbi:hypothetical protein HELRODRAFT_174288 [Helobdella robusta]|uniref:Uncharacterized protein n=1 Tax=Helobdella robusta TaxID=6412 RepID=T1F7Y2_HELRO|nr:hypothetical protein HELRODRAFT_174288 [Helobdella robusta]ESO02855.1 hypothetical protein HELRODRAFT_174288 [Helobdella robusta]
MLTDNDYLNGKDVREGEVNVEADVHLRHELVTDDDSSFEITPPTCTWKESLVLVYPDNGINDGFIADENAICIALSLIGKKDVNSKYYNMQLNSSFGHSTLRKISR